MEKQVSSINSGCRENYIFTYKRMNLCPYFIPLTKINLEWVKDLNENPETIKRVEEDIKKKYFGMGLSNDFIGYVT